MLSSRYLHLHEALGLGPMWLKQGAKVLPAHPAAPARAPQPAPEAAPPRANPHDTPARLAAMSAVGRTAAPNVSDTPARPSEPVRPSEKTLPAAAGSPSETAPAAAAADVSGIRPAAVMVVSICPAPEDGAAGKLFSGSAGVLLDNMLAAVGLTPACVHKTSWVKTGAAFTPEPSPEQVEAALPQMQAELAAAQARAVLFLGQAFLRPHHAGAVARLCGGTPCFTVPHPARLLRQPQLKKQAWQELKKLRAFLQSQT